MEALPNVDECHELKNIKYKTMPLNGAPTNETKASNDMSNLEKFLEAEKTNNGNEPWCKLNKTSKLTKLSEYVEIYSKANDLDDEEVKRLNAFLKDSLDKKRLSRVKDVIYDKITGLIKDVPALTYNKSSRHFTLKNIDKRVSTLKSLAPKKGTATTRSKHVSPANKQPVSETDEK